MTRVIAGQVDVLVSTTVIEVGVDVQNATTMVIMDAERFGVSRLHQLRGRVGRGAHAGLCLPVTEAPAVVADDPQLANILPSRTPSTTSWATGGTSSSTRLN